MNVPFSLIQVFDDPPQGLRGNISAVISLQQEMDDAAMQRIAEDFNQSATTFVWPNSNSEDYQVRWFAPDAEIGLCGHGTMAAIAHLANRESMGKRIRLHHRQGWVGGLAQPGEQASIFLQTIPVLEQVAADENLRKGLGVPIEGYFKTGNKDIVLLPDEASLRHMKPDFARLRQRKSFGYSVTAPGEDVDFVSRTLVPHVQQLEDHATGSSHAALVPFWRDRLSKNQFIARQLSSRGGFFYCTMQKEEVQLSGHYTVLAQGEWRG